MGGISVKKVKEWLKKVRPLKTWQLLLKEADIYPYRPSGVCDK